MSCLSAFSYKEITDKLTLITGQINLREINRLKCLGVNTNSMLAGLANGFISVVTSEESQVIYELKQEIMSRTVSEMGAARERNLTRRAARRAEFKSKLNKE